MRVIRNTPPSCTLKRIYPQETTPITSHMRIRATLVSEHHPTRTETAMSAHAREHGTGAQWTHEAAIDDGIIRVRADRSTRWFITPDQPGTDVAEELHGFPSAAAAGSALHRQSGLGSAPSSSSRQQVQRQRRPAAAGSRSGLGSSLPLFLSLCF